MSEEYTNNTIAELQVICKSRNIKGYSGLTKANIIKLLNGEHVDKESKNVPKKVRTELWKIHFNTLDGKCYTCAATIGFDNFEAGHIVAKKNGGKSELSNLKPICRGCNASMGTNDLEEFKKTLNVLKVCAACNGSGIILILHKHTAICRHTMCKITNTRNICECKRTPPPVEEVKEVQVRQDIGVTMDVVNSLNLESSDFSVKQTFIKMLNRFHYANIDRYRNAISNYLSFPPNNGLNAANMLWSRISEFMMMAQNNKYKIIEPCQRNMYGSCYLGDYLENYCAINNFINDDKVNKAMIIQYIKDLNSI